mgnify:CR=1 FL=1
MFPSACFSYELLCKLLQTVGGVVFSYQNKSSPLMEYMIIIRLINVFLEGKFNLNSPTYVTNVVKALKFT